MLSRSYRDQDRHPTCNNDLKQLTSVRDPGRCAQRREPTDRYMYCWLVGVGRSVAQGEKNLHRVAQPFEKKICATKIMFEFRRGSDRLLKI